MKTFIYGLRRSGNHGVISWVLDNLNTSSASLEWVSKERIKTNYSDIVFLNDISMGPNFCKNTKKPWKNIYNSTFSSYKNIFLSVEESFYSPKQLGFNDQKVNYIFIFRDILNLSASRFKKDMRVKNVDCEKSIRDSINKYFLMYNHYKKLKNEGQNTLFINYNKWLSSYDYKFKLSKKLNLQTCADNQNISQVGPGSSFGDKTVNIEALLSRYKIINMSLFKKVLSSNEIQITKKHFYGICKELDQEISFLENEISS